MVTLAQTFNNGLKDVRDGSVVRRDGTDGTGALRRDYNVHGRCSFFSTAAATTTLRTFIHLALLHFCPTSAYHFPTTPFLATPAAASAADGAFRDAARRAAT